ncbi:MAG: glycoside hydrolase family 127 protein, partial [Clostridia bacterium]|nr:glycoside hydrolase family 127 protein [Clostridia bacterium]
EGWERVPYWLDGFIPLAWLLDDEEMKNRARRYVEHIMDAQEADGWICPCQKEERTRYDVWVVFLICKVLAMYADFTGDERATDAVEKALKQLNSQLNHCTLFGWGQSRWFECYVPILWLHEKRPRNNWLLSLAYKLRMQGMNWRYFFENWQHREPDGKGEWTFITHVVNIAMALKAEAMIGRLEDCPAHANAKHALELLWRDHGMAAWHFTGDECLSGDSPTHGTELCSVVEAMYSYEHLIQFTGEGFWSDLLERLTYNALPATISPDMWSHQYDQMTNQIRCIPFEKDQQPFITNSEESHIFGLEPNYGCCTANMGQGWPKFALSALMQMEDGLVITAIAPVSVQAVFDGVPISVRIETDYPFKSNYCVHVKTERPATFALKLRIPGFAFDGMVDGKPAGDGVIRRTWQQEETIHVSFRTKAQLRERPQGLYCLEDGPLLFSVAPDTVWTKVEYQRDGVERKFPYCDYHITASSEWNYAFAGTDFIREESAVGDIPFSPDHPAVALRAQMAQITWHEENGACTPLPQATEPLSKPVSLRLIPYGCTTLRMTEMPLLK